MSFPAQRLPCKPRVASNLPEVTPMAQISGMARVGRIVATPVELAPPLRPARDDEPWPTRNWVGSDRFPKVAGKGLGLAKQKAPCGLSKQGACSKSCFSTGVRRNPCDYSIQPRRMQKLPNQAFPPAQQRMVAVWNISASGADIHEHYLQLSR